jgi:hypothetical protein
MPHHDLLNALFLALCGVALLLIMTRWRPRRSFLARCMAAACSKPLGVAPPPAWLPPAVGVGSLVTVLQGVIWADSTGH